MKISNRVNKRIIIILIFLVLLAILAVWGFVVQKKDAWFETGSVDGQKIIDFNTTPGVRLISESRGEFSYQANYIYKDNKDIDSSETIKKKLKRDFSRNGWRLENEEMENDHQLLDFKSKEKNESLKVVIGYRNSQGTFFSFDYR